MMGAKALGPASNDLVAGIRSAAADDLARLGALARKTEGFIQSELRGRSMAPAIPDGAFIRIRPADEDLWRSGQVVAFVAGHRFMAHRIVYEGRRGATRQFVLTQGDGNWLCDPPVNRSTIVGEVVAFYDGTDWIPVGSSVNPLYRRIVADVSQAVMKVALALSPGLAIALARAVSWARMGPRLAISRLQRAMSKHVRH